jgi:hypothetical protein
VTDNLISGQTMTFITIHTGLHIFESKVKPVKHKQHTVEFEEDFTCVLADECLTIRTPPEDGSPTSSAIPVTVKLNRKGLIDSEVIATGKIMLPVENTAIDNISVGLFQVDEEKSEIAIAKLSVVISVAKRKSGGVLGAILKEIETMMLEYSRGRLSASDPTVADTLQRFLTSVTPLRRLAESIVDLLTWRKSYVRSWLLLLTILMLPGVGLVLGFGVIYCAAFHIPLPLLDYIPSAHFEIEDTIPESPEQSVELNILFLFHIMTRLSLFAQFLARIKNSVYIVAIFAILTVIRLEWFIVAIMLYNTFAVTGVLRYYASHSRSDAPRRFSSEKKDPGESQLIITENQRWWFGRWSDMLIGQEAHPWEDQDKNPLKNRDSVTPPIGMQWTSKWQIVDLPDCDEGWRYGRDFSQVSVNKRREIADFVRSRRWRRSFGTQQSQ